MGGPLGGLDGMQVLTVGIEMGGMEKDSVECVEEMRREESWIGCKRYERLGREIM